MNKMTIGVSMIVAGITAVVVEALTEKRLLEEFDLKFQEELDKSVDYLVEMKKAAPTEEYVETRKIVGATVDLAKPSPEEIVNKNQKTRYDKIIRDESYEPEEALVPPIEDGPTIYSITTDEYVANESGYLQSTLTYTSDGVCLDEENDYVEDWEDMIGNAKPPFGENSGEAHVVYLRNDKMRQEFEVIHDPDISAADMLGDPEGIVRS